MSEVFETSDGSLFYTQDILNVRTDKHRLIVSLAKAGQFVQVDIACNNADCAVLLQKIKRSMETISYEDYRLVADKTINPA